MGQVLKKFLLYFVLVSVFCFILYLLLKRYDFNGDTISWIISNKYYLLVLFFSLIVCLSIYGNKDVQSKFILYFIIFINLLYLCFLFVMGNLGLSLVGGLIILVLLIFGFVGIYIKGWLGYTIISVSLIGSLIMLFLGSIPLFEKGPDFQGFENDFVEKILIYSDMDIIESSAQIVKDNKIYPISQGLKSYDFKIKDGSSQVVFKSDTFYENMYCFIVFKGGSFLEILPQSAIIISDNFEIEVLTGVVKYYSSDSNNLSFLGLDRKETSERVINIVNDRYYDLLKLYLKREMGSELLYNESVLKISKGTLTILSKIFPGKYDKNLENLQEYVDVFGVDLSVSEKSDGEIKTKDILNSVWGGLKKGVDMVD